MVLLEGRRPCPKSVVRCVCPVIAIVSASSVNVIFPSEIGNLVLPPTRAVEPLHEMFIHRRFGPLLDRFDDTEAALFPERRPLFIGEAIGR